MLGRASIEETNDLFEELSRNADSKEWEELITEISMAAGKDPAYDPVRWESMINKILHEEKKPAVHSFTLYTKWWWAAASIILLLATGSYFLFFNNKNTPGHGQESTAAVMHDVKAPGTSRAMITLSNGQKIFLDSANNGTLATQNKVKLVKTADGKIEYRVGSLVGSHEIEYNTLSNPRGSKVIDMTLADGSRIWLNAGSSVTYPVAFVGNERRVTMNGEAYFEVVHNEKMPFKISKDGVEVTVLGTHFNVNAYDDEADIKVTLLEGSVKVNKENSSELLKPGQQAVVTDKINVANDVDVVEVMAWKNGYFSFKGADIETIMRQVARWYDVDVVFEGKMPSKHYRGKASRDLNASQMLKVLEESGIKFKIEGKKIIVMP